MSDTATRLRLDPGRTALIIQDMQNDVVTEGGAFADAGPAAHAKSQNTVENLVRLADALRASGGAVIHVWYMVEKGCRGQATNAPLFQGLKDSGAMERGSWGAAPCAGLEPQEGDFVVEKMRMNPFYGSTLQTILQGLGITAVISGGALTNMAVEHTARHAADAGYEVVMPLDGTATFNDDWQRAAFEYALANVSTIATCDEIIAALQR